MDKEVKEKFMSIVEAFLDGKKIEYSVDGKLWFDASLPSWNPNYVYRIKPEPKYRPFNTQEECWEEMHKHPDFGWVKRITGGYKQIMAVHKDMFNKHCADFAGQTGTVCFEFKYIYENYTFADGTPFGIKEG